MGGGRNRVGGSNGEVSERGKGGWELGWGDASGAVFSRSLSPVPLPYCSQICSSKMARADLSIPIQAVEASPRVRE